jgi:hypothetical protein
MDHDHPDIQGNPYDVIDGSGSVRGSSKPRRPKHTTEITCNALVFIIFAVGVASILLGIFLAFFATVQTAQAGVACKPIARFPLDVAFESYSYLLTYSFYLFCWLVRLLSHC